MDITNVRLVKGMSKDEVNSAICFLLSLEDEIYLGNRHKHNWRCKCGKIFKREWMSIRENKSYDCGCKKYLEQENRYKYEVEKDGEYEYIRSYRKGDILPSGKVVKHCAYIEITHKYCGTTYVVNVSGFINSKRRCTNCCKSYENSFAHYIEVELGEPLEKYWDFEKNTVNPYHIWRNSKNKVWIRCQEKDYHGSYDVYCYSFTQNSSCSYCCNIKVHPNDSFGKRFPDKIRCWHSDNDINPFNVAPNSSKRYRFLCDICGHEWESAIYNVSNGCWCPMCSSSKGEKQIKQYLNINNINYIHDEPYFDDLLSDKGNPLRPDFILPEHKIWIEYDGEFHFKKMYDNDGHEIIKEHDKRKDEYAIENGWKLIRIPYTEFDNIENILEKELNL